MAGIHRLLIDLVVGVATGEAEPACFWMMALMAISWMVQGWWWVEFCCPGVSAAVSAIPHYCQRERERERERERGGGGG